MKYSKSNMQTLEKLIEILDLNHIFYSISKEMTQFYSDLAHDIENEPTWGICINIDDYFVLQEKYKNNFLDNSNTNKGYLCPIFIDDNSSIDIHLFVKSSVEKLQKNFKKLLLNNYQYISLEHEKFNGSTKFKASFYSLFRVFFKTQDFRLLMSKIFEDENTIFAYIYPHMSKYSDCVFQNISYKTNQVYISGKKLNSCIEFSKIE